MASDNKLELVVEVDTNKANASIKSVNAGLSSMEQTAAKAARGASAGIDGMTASMVKGATAGNLIADAIKKAVEWAKNWTIEAAKMAAHESRMEASGRALAKAHGITAEAFEKSVEAVRKIGYHGEEAVHTIDRLIVADLDLSKATGLAKIAKDAAAIENIEAPEALEKILQAIEFGNQRQLRSAGLVVNFQRDLQAEELRLGRTLSDNEKVQVRYNAVMKAAAAIQGAHAGALGEAGMQMKMLALEAHDLREAVGAQFQDQLKGLIGMLRDLVGFLKDNASWLAKFGEAALYVSAALATAALVSKIQGITGAVQGLTAALAVNPWALMLTGIAAGGAIIYKTWKDTQEGLGQRWDEEKRSTVSKVIGRLRPGVGMADLLRATFPPASITGAPKIRAMEVAVEEEEQRRGPCMGGIGWISMDCQLELSVAIRTAVFAEGRVYYHAGSGITADSDPEQEADETSHKARAFFRALGLDETRL
jgi:hypothetical protein